MLQNYGGGCLEKLLAIILLLVFAAPGCSVYMAAKQPDKKNVNLFTTGTPRSELLAEFGNPTATEEKDGVIHDIFRFKQGYSSGAKAGRAVFHGVADVLTLGLWEVVGTPTEAVFDGDDMSYEVVYNTDKRVEQIIPLNVPKPSGTSTAQ